MCFFSDALVGHKINKHEGNVKGAQRTHSAGKHVYLIAFFCHKTNIVYNSPHFVKREKVHFLRRHLQSTNGNMGVLTERHPLILGKRSYYIVEGEVGIKASARST